MLETNDRLERLEKQIQIIEKIMKETKMIENDFNFDELLDEVDSIETTEPAKEVPANLDEIDEIDDLLSEEKVATVKAQDQILDDLTAQEEQIKMQKKTVQQARSEAIADTVQITYEYADEAKAFLKAYDELEMEKRDLIQRVKDLKEEYTDAGVDCKAVLKAQKEIIKEIKETPETANLVAQMKEMIKQDDTLMTNATVIAG